MRLTKAILATFVGGQIEVQSSNDPKLLRGEIAAITMVGDAHEADVKVTLKWVAQGVGYPPLPHRWVKDDTSEMAFSLMLFVLSGIGEGRLCLLSEALGEMAVLYPAGGSRLDPAKVEGLDPSKLGR